MNHIEKLIRENLKDCRIDLIGFANKERFEGVDPQHNPFSIFPGILPVNPGLTGCKATVGCLFLPFFVC